MRVSTQKSEFSSPRRRIKTSANGGNAAGQPEVLREKAGPHREHGASRLGSEQAEEVLHRHSNQEQAQDHAEEVVADRAYRRDRH